jgi:hypothetical protein
MLGAMIINIGEEADVEAAKVEFVKYCVLTAAVGQLRDEFSAEGPRQGDRGACGPSQGPLRHHRVLPGEEQRFVRHRQGADQA